MPVTKKVVTKKTAASPAAETAAPAKKVVAKKTVAKKTVAKKAAPEATPADATVQVAETVQATESPATPETQTSNTNDVFTDVLNDLATLTASCKTLTNRVKALQKQVAKEHKELSKKGGKKKNTSGKPRAPSGFAKPSRITLELAKFLGVNESEKFARTQVTKMITTYIKEHNLQNEENKKIIVPDAKLKKLLQSGDEEVSFFNLQKFMKVHYLKDEPAAATTV